MNIVLASGSPRRKELLTKLLNKYNMNYEIVSNKVDESLVKQLEASPIELVKKLSYLKAESVFNEIRDKYKELIVIGADTIVYFENQFLGKPQNEEMAEEMLGKLNGKSNEVYTGMTVFIKKENEIEYKTVFSKASVCMKVMSNQDILEYINTKEPLDKAGAYAVQGIGSKYIEKYIGNFDAIVGLDVEKLEAILKGAI